jgi:hypothetical protein
MPKLVWLSSRLNSGRTSSDVCRDNVPVELFVRDNFPASSLPASMHGSSNFSKVVSFLSGPSSTIMPEPCLFHCFATSSSTFSARPSSLQPLPQNPPTNTARDPRPEDVNVRLCFFVKVRKAMGRNVAGGRIMGRTDGPVSAAAAFCCAAAANACRRGGAVRGFGVYAGVPNPGDEENCCAFVVVGAVSLNTGTGSFGVDSTSSMVVVAQLICCRLVSPAVQKIEKPL